MDIDVIANLETNIEEVQSLDVDIANTGPQGLSAYQVYQKNGGILSETEWLESLKGAPGTQGAPGEDGYTPQKGVDYWTENDKNEIKEYCDSQIIGVLGGSY